MNTPKLKPGIRLSSLNTRIMESDETRYWAEHKTKINKLLVSEGFAIDNLDGRTQPNMIGKNGVHNHTPGHDAYLWLGQPNPAELANLTAKNVSIQTLDKNMYIEPHTLFNFSDHRIVKPNMIYLPDDAPNHDKNVYNLLYKNCQTLFNTGTINEYIENPDGSKRRSLDYIVQVIKSPEDVIHNLYNNIKAKQGIHNENHMVPVDPKFLQTGILKLSDIEEPEFKVAVFLSASKNQTSENITKTQDLGYFIANRKWGGISGAGNTGLMKELQNAMASRGAYTEGSNCPHIVVFEDIPDGLSLYIGTEDTNVRKAVMIARAEATVIWWGGGGTLDEAASDLYLRTLHSHKNNLLTKEIFEKSAVKSNMAHGKNMDIVFYNQEGQWDNITKIYEIFGLEQGKDFHVATSTRQVEDNLDKFHENTIKRKRGKSINHIGAIQNQLFSGIPFAS